MTSKVRKADLVNKTFTTYKCSTLHGFSPTQPKQRTRTINSLREHLCTEFDLFTNNNEEEEEEEESIDEGNIIKKIELKRFRVDGWESLPMIACPLIELRVAIKFENEDTISLTTISMIPSQEQSLNKDYSSYPILLVRGKSVVWTMIKPWMEWSFNCHVDLLDIPTSISESIVKWCGERIIKSVKEEEKEGSNILELEFMVKHEPKEDLFYLPTEQKIDPVTFSLDIKDIKKYLGIIKENNELLFSDILPKQKYINKDNFKLSELNFILIKLGSPIVHIDIKDNKLKFLAGTSKPDLVEILQELSNLVEKSFEMYECSPLYNFRTDRRQCARLENSLEKALKTKLSLTTINNDNNDNNRKRSDITNSKGEIHKVNIEPYSIEGWDSPYTPVEITVTVRLYTIKNDFEATIIMLPNKEQPETEDDSFCLYPLILARCNIRLWTPISLWIEKIFDCKIFKLIAPTNMLGNIAEWWASYLFQLPIGEDERVYANDVNHRSRNNLELEFTTTATTEINTFTVTLDMEDVKNIFRIIRASNMTLLEAIRCPIVYIDLNKNKLKMLTGSPKLQLIRVLEDLCTAATTNF
ncbi:hypothetical protein INT45_011827 [Circinella minor]|uniref:Uncharacterized protein n=1 Tax=Circinella minor TaxID=1195481 RepID=A0A8H7VS79_9FUNG|nr:hypothetical protein INT45_011827 [Circinella minor]